MSRQVIWLIILIIGTIFLIGIIITLITLAIRVVTTPRVVPTPTPIPTPLVQQVTPTPTPGPTIIVVTPTPTPVQTTLILNKTFIGPGFTLDYPASWGLLTCSNSPNFEFDPISGVDQPNVVCGFAQKPITILVDNNLRGCGSVGTNIGGNIVFKTTTLSTNFTEHLWCTNSNPVLKISHRLSTNNFPATSPIDYSPEIERMIATLRFVTLV